MCVQASVCLSNFIYLWAFSCEAVYHVTQLGLGQSHQRNNINYYHGWSGTYEVSTSWFSICIFQTIYREVLVWQCLLFFSRPSPSGASSCTTNICSRVSQHLCTYQSDCSASSWAWFLGLGTTGWPHSPSFLTLWVWPAQSPKSWAHSPH